MRSGFVRGCSAVFWVTAIASAGNVLAPAGTAATVAAATAATAGAALIIFFVAFLIDDAAAGGSSQRSDGVLDQVAMRIEVGAGGG